MHLDVYICGPGYGEMVLLRWEEDGVVIAGLIDCYSSAKNRQPLLQWFNHLEIERFAFVAATHPHLDHLLSLDFVMAAYSGRVDYLWMWPVNHVKAMVYFRKLARAFPNSRNQLGLRADAVEALFAERKRQFFEMELGKPNLESFEPLARIYPTIGATKSIEVKCISPWDQQIIKFSESVIAGTGVKNNVQDIHGEANLVSGGFVVQFGKSQIVLGGDMESDNWTQLINSGKCPINNPCVVKVSHHGSRTGLIPDMWGSDGFLGKSCEIAVVTPWNRKLPDPEILREIATSGCATYVTGQNLVARDNLSLIHIRVFDDGSSPKVISRSPSVKLIVLPITGVRLDWIGFLRSCYK